MSDSPDTDSRKHAFATPAGSQPILLPDGRQSPIALHVQRGVRRLFAQLGHATLPEFTLASGRRADVMALSANGVLTIVEIKSCVADFRADRKWPDYKEFCDRFFFAKPPELDPDIFPASEGLMVGDGHDAAILRMAGETPLPPARRKAMLLKLTRLGADRIHVLMDPTDL